MSCDQELIGEQTNEAVGAEYRTGRKRPTEEEVSSGSADYRKARKRRQNRESAARSRARKSEVFQRLSDEVSTLRQDNAHLLTEVTRLNAIKDLMAQELTQYRMLFGSCRDVNSDYSLA